MDESLLFNQFSAKEIVEILAPFLTDRRKERIDQILQNRLFCTHLALESPSDIYNALAAFRSAEAFGVHQIHVINSPYRKRQGKRTAMGAMPWIERFSYQTTLEFIQENQKQGRLLAGACMDGEISCDQLPLDREICLVFGNEHQGLSKEMKKACDLTFSIPMFGMVESLNLSVSCAISLYEYTKRKRALIQKQETYASEKLKALYYVRTLTCKDSYAILQKCTAG